MPEILDHFPSPDWTKPYATPADLMADLRGLTYKGPGWYQSASDTVLVLDRTDAFGVMPLLACVWNQYNARRLLLLAVELPVQIGPQ